MIRYSFILHMTELLLKLTEDNKAPSAVAGIDTVEYQGAIRKEIAQ